MSYWNGKNYFCYLKYLCNTIGNDDDDYFGNFLNPSDRKILALWLLRFKTFQNKNIQFLIEVTKKFQLKNLDFPKESGMN